jgi:hypothetical protein
VRVLLVGVDPISAAEVMNLVKGVFAPLAIRVNYVLETADLEINPPNPGATGAVLDASESGAYIQASKDHFGGVRPPDADVVYTMLGPELSGSVAGQADCVGGIAFPDAAFAVGEFSDLNENEIRKSAKIAAHEIAHLLAAHHHFANCAEGETSRAADVRIDVCTLMLNDVGLVSLKMSTLEAAVVRRWGLDYLVDRSADPTPSTSPTPSPEPEPEPEPPVIVAREVTAATDGEQIAGEVSAPDGWYECASVVPVQLQRKKDGAWRKVKNGQTSNDWSFSFAVARSGTYRVMAREIPTSDGDTCAEAKSSRLRIR